ncbi:hypothetical protein Aperf_G00000128456 [Anoplocephala perfoliata]
MLNDIASLHIISVYGVLYYHSPYYDDTLSTLSYTVPPIVNIGENLPDSKEYYASDINFPIYRLYFHQTDAYLSQSTTSCEVVAQEQNPFSCEIEWQWIPHPKYNATLLRNLATGNYLCFDDEGKPVAVKQAKLERCLLRALFPEFDPVRRANDMEVCEEDLFQGNESDFFDTILSADKNQTVNYGTLKPKRNGVKAHLPAAVFLKSLLNDRSRQRSNVTQHLEIGYPTSDEMPVVKTARDGKRSEQQT